MARTDNLNNFLTDVADAIRTKTGSTEQIQASQFDTEIESINTGITPNGIVESYYAYAGENISAGDLVQFINGAGETADYGTSVDTLISSKHNTDIIAAAELQDGNVFVVIYESGTLYGIVAVISGATITLGTLTQLTGAAAYTGTSIKVEVLKNGNVFIAHGKTSSRYLCGIVCEINGTTITSGTDTQLSTAGYSGVSIGTLLLGNGNVLIAHSYGNSGSYLFGMIVEINGTAITVLADTQLDVSIGAKYDINLHGLKNGNVVIIYGGNSNTQAVVATIKAATIEVGANMEITSVNEVVFSTVLLENENIFLTLMKSEGNSNYSLSAKLLTVSGTEIKAGDIFQLATSNLINKISVALAKNGNAFVSYCYGTSQYLYGVVCSIDSATITAGTNTQLNSATYSAKATKSISLSNGTIFVAHAVGTSGSFSGLKAQIFVAEDTIPSSDIVFVKYETQVKVATSTPFDGIAKTSGSGGTEDLHNEQVEIYTLQG